MSNKVGNRQKVVLVTGASSGIGYATAIELAKRGYKVFAGARRLEPMELLQEYGIIIFKLDVSDLESVKHTKKFIEDKTGEKYLDLLFNNAGQSCTFPALDVSDENFKLCFEVNVFGPMRLVRELSSLVINAHGVIAFTGSVSGIIPVPFSCVYSATKAAIHQYAATLRLEMKPFDVKVINVVTGGVKTNIADDRPLPQGSLFDIPLMKDVLLERQQMAARNNPITAEKYAYQVVNDFEAATSTNGPLNVYRGKMAYFLGHLMYWCPRFIVESFIVKKFKLTEVFLVLSQKYSKTKLD